MHIPLPTFETIYRDFHPKVLRYMTGVVDAEEAADLTQVAMIKVSQHLHEFRGESSLATWIYRIATNVALDRLRQRSPERVALADEDDDSADVNVPAELQSPSTESTAAREEMSACVREFVDRVPAAYRGVLILSDIEGFTNAEIAEITGLSLETVKIRLHRGRLKLRSELESGCAIGRDGASEVSCERTAPVRIK